MGIKHALLSCVNINCFHSNDDADLTMVSLAIKYFYELSNRELQEFLLTESWGIKGSCNPPFQIANLL